jgi:hypothetical protein
MNDFLSIPINYPFYFIGILLQQQEKLQPKLQKNTIVPLIPESLAYTV